MTFVALRERTASMLRRRNELLKRISRQVKIGPKLRGCHSLATLGKQAPDRHYKTGQGCVNHWTGRGAGDVESDRCAERKSGWNLHSGQAGYRAAGAGIDVDN